MFIYNTKKTSVSESANLNDIFDLTKGLSFNQLGVNLHNFKNSEKRLNDVTEITSAEIWPYRYITVRQKC